MSRRLRKSRAAWVALALLAGACNSAADAHRAVSAHADCVICHEPEYKAAKNPVHVDNFPTACGACHSEDAWKPAKKLDHAKVFPLLGVHAKTECSACHTKGYRKGDTPTECVGCHKQDYDGTTNPVHVGNISMQCNACHTEDGWKPAKDIDHDKVFPLVDAHATVACASCHKQGYRNGDTPNTCVGCHQADYDRSPYPGHDTFPTTCQDCHTTKAWKPASGSHPESRFPIASGRHANIPCNDCHKSALGTPNNKNNTDCINCHTNGSHHTRPGIDSHHQEVGGYLTGSSSPNFCLRCHSDGRNRDN